MTSLQDRSSGSVMSDVERDEIVLNLSRSLWNLHMARYYVGKMDKENKSLNLALASRSTEIILSQGNATTKEVEKYNGTMVQNTEVNMAEGQYERSVADALTIGIEPITDDEEVKDSIESEMLMSINERASPIGALDVLFQEDSSDLGSLVNRESQGLCDGDLAPRAYLQPGHLFIGARAQHAQHTRSVWGIEP